MTELVRSALRDLFKTASDAHPGLLLQRGWLKYTQTDSENAGAGGKTEHIQRICDIPASALYHRAFNRWLKNTSAARFHRCVMKIDNRLLIGLNGSGALETGCSVSHIHGMPYIPGSSIKGALRAWAEKALPEQQAQFNELFGSHDASLSGLVNFYDAWWVPDSGPNLQKNKPFVEEIVTPHHTDYYKSGAADATDLDSPVPNAMIGVRGSFLFVYESASDYAGLIKIMLEKTLMANGIGAKTSAGYGYFSKDIKCTQDYEQKAVLVRVGSLPAQEQLELRLRIELQGKEEDIIKMFSKDLNKTRERPDFEQLVEFIQREHSVQISSWKERKGSKNSTKAYKFFTSATGDEE